MAEATSPGGASVGGRRWNDLPVAAGLALVCLIALFWVDGPRSRAAVLAEGAQVGLTDLALTAGLRDGSGRRMRADPFPVTIVQEGGPSWVSDGVAAGVVKEGSFREVDGPHLLRVSSHVSAHAMVLELKLWRQGWDVRGMEPVRLHFAPWLTPLAALLGLAAALASRRPSIGVFVAGMAAQLGLWSLPRPGGLGYAAGALADAGGTVPLPLWLRGWGHDPLLWRLERWLAHDSSTITAVLGAVLATSLVLVAFDHRRSSVSTSARARREVPGDGEMGNTAKSAGGAMGVPLALALGLAVLYAVGGLALVDAAARSGLGAVWREVPMLTSLVALSGAWTVPVRRGWKSGRA